MRLTRIALVALGCAAALGAAACGGASSDVGGDSPGDGKQIFSDAGCGSCHTFTAAGSNGTRGPALDGTTLSEQQVADQVEGGGGGMPAFAGDLTQTQIDAVASFIVAEGANN